MPTDPNNSFPESVLFVITRGDSIGGGQIHVRDLCRALQIKGVRVGVAMGSSGALQKELDLSGIPHFLVPGLSRSVNPLSDLIAVRKLCGVVRTFNPALISTHTAKAGLVGRLAGILTGTPFLFTAHGWQFAEGIPFWQKCLVLVVETLLARVTKRIITVSDYDRRLALQYKVGAENKVVLVHNGMPWRQEVALDTKENDPVRLVMVARFQEQKDHATLFSALEKLENYPWILELIGDGPDLMRWVEWVRVKGWTQRVTFHGQILGVPEVLDRCDVFLLISLWEGFPRSILEAMRASLPVIASDVGGVRESVVDGKTGFIVPIRDSFQIAHRLQTLLQDRALRHELGREGRQRFESEFTFEAMLSKTAEVWNTILG